MSFVLFTGDVTLSERNRRIFRLIFVFGLQTGMVTPRLILSQFGLVMMVMIVMAMVIVMVCVYGGGRMRIARRLLGRRVHAWYDARRRGEKSHHSSIHVCLDVN